MKREFTVGEISKVLNVARSTVIYWIRDGRINAFQLPGGNNRVTRENLIKFMKTYNIPLEFIEEYTKKRILIVEDDPSQLKIFKDAFKRELEFEVQTASSGFEAGILTRQYRPHIIVMDIALKDVDGREVCKTLRDDVELSETKILAISGVISKKELNILKKQGFDDYLQKPFKLDVFRDKIREILEM